MIFGQTFSARRANLALFSASGSIRNWGRCVQGRSKSLPASPETIATRSRRVSRPCGRSSISCDQNRPASPYLRRRSTRRREPPSEGDGADEISARTTDDARQRCRCPGPAYRVVQDVPASGRADPAELAARYGAHTSVRDWHERLVCSHCGRRRADMVVTGALNAAVEGVPRLSAPPRA